MAEAEERIKKAKENLQNQTQDLEIAKEEAVAKNIAKKAENVESLGRELSNKKAEEAGRCCSTTII